MITCKECVFWERCTDPNWELLSHGRCNQGCFEYRSPSEHVYDEALEKYVPIESCNNKAYYWDAESYKASIVTGEDFGCIHARRSNEKL